MQKRTFIATAIVLVTIGILIAAAAALGQATEHCPDHQGHEGKIESGDLNGVVLDAGTEFCVKGATDATGKLVADGETDLSAYLGNGHDVSYYVVYGAITTTSTTQPSTTTTTSPSTTSSTIVIEDEHENPVQTPVAEAPHNVCVDPDGHSFKTSEACHEPTETTDPPAQDTGTLNAQPLTTLPKTGMENWLLWIGLGLGFAGVAIIVITGLTASGTNSEDFERDA